MLIVATVASSLISGSVAAAGSASLSMSPSSGSYNNGSTISIVIGESSTEQVNTIQADYVFDTSKLQFLGASCGGAFEIAAQANANGLVCGTTTAKTGYQTVGTVNFRTISSGTAVLSFSGSSHIYSTTQADVWNGNTSGASFMISNPAPVVDSPASTAPSATNNSAAASAASNTPATQQSEANGAGSVESVSIKLYTAIIKVLDSRGNTVKNAFVSLGTKTASTDRAGKASFSDVKPGTYDIKAVLGNLNYSGKITINNNSKTTQNFMVQLPKAKKNHYGFLLFTITLIGGGIIAFRKRAAHITQAKKVTKTVANKKSAAKRSTKPLAQLATAKR